MQNRARRLYIFFALAICTGIVFGLRVLSCASAAPASRLDYQVNHDQLRNPWLVLASSEWPSMSPESLSALTAIPTKENKQIFWSNLQALVSKQWLPDNIDE